MIETSHIVTGLFCRAPSGALSQVKVLNMPR